MQLPHGESWGMFAAALAVDLAVLALIIWGIP